ncbi:hypothetical protein MMC18_005520 [Xylographa bjoerkii]|nr:hypothetical protein [Xylographa bjoerkii]
MALPESVICPRDAAAFKQSMDSYWSQHVLSDPATFSSSERLSISSSASTTNEEIRVAREKRKDYSLFVAMATLRFSVLRVSRECYDRSWRQVDECSKAEDEKSLAVIGGRNSAVGMGGLVLGGTLLHHQNELVLASRPVTKASASTNPDLWRARKGGSNNFGIVTRFTAHSFSSTKIWGGFLYMPASQAAKFLAAFHKCVNRADAGDPSATYDNYAAGPIASFSYIQYFLPLILAAMICLSYLLAWPRKLAN